MNKIVNKHPKNKIHKIFINLKKKKQSNKMRNRINNNPKMNRKKSKTDKLNRVFRVIINDSWRN